MDSPRFFIHAAAATPEDLIDIGARHGRVVDTKAYRDPSGRAVYGSVEVTPPPQPQEGEPTP